MIRDCKSKDLDRTMELWLDINILSHPFIDVEYWKTNYDTVKTLMLNAIIYIYEENDVIQVFLGLMNDYIAGIFVSQQFQSKGIGTQLLDYVKREKEVLSLSVYKENNKAVNFYRATAGINLSERTSNFHLSIANFQKISLLTIKKSLLNIKALFYGFSCYYMGEIEASRR